MAGSAPSCLTLRRIGAPRCGLPSRNGRRSWQATRSGVPMSEVEELGKDKVGGAAVDSQLSRLQEFGQLLEPDPAAVEAKARQILGQRPEDSDAQVLLAAALRNKGDVSEAIAILEPLAMRRGDWAIARLELGLAWRQLGDHQKAIGALSQAVNLDNSLSEAWRAMGDEYPEIGDIVAADRAFAHHQNLAVTDPQLQIGRAS